MTATRPTSPPKLGRVARWKLTEPLRLYVWPALLLLLVSGLSAGFRDGDWWRAALFLAAAGLVALALEAARESVYSPAGMVRGLRDAAGSPRG